MSEVITSALGQLENQLAQAKIVITRRQQALRLFNHTDFRQLILDGFCLHDAARYAQESGDPALSAEARADALNMAQASGHLKRYLSLTCQQGAHAERTMPELLEAIEEVRAEGDGESAE